MPTAPDADDDAILAAVGAAITAARTEAGMSQRALATASSVDRAFLNAVEAGTRRPTVITLVRIARALDTTAADLVNGIQ